MAMTLKDLKRETVQREPLSPETVKGIALAIGLVILCAFIAASWDTIVTLTIGFAILFGIALVGLGPIGILALVAIFALFRRD